MHRSDWCRNGANNGIPFFALPRHSLYSIADMTNDHGVAVLKKVRGIQRCFQATIQYPIGITHNQFQPI
jgi:hypothetical protein